LLGRVIAFDQSPEGLSTQRILELTSQSILGGLCPAEQDELDRLRKLYPDLPLDDDDSLKKAIEACGRVAREGQRSVRDKSSPRP
jgi:hypothetical protein